MQGEKTGLKSLFLGSVAAALAMIALGFLFFGLMRVSMFTPLDPADAVAVQAALGRHLPASGTYIIPGGGEAWRSGPAAVVKFVSAGGAPAGTQSLIAGLLQFLAAALAMGLALRAGGGSRARQVRMALWYGLAAGIFMHLGGPIWFGYAWRHALIEGAFDSAMFIAGGLVLARWFTSEPPTGRCPAASAG
jgi:hypothetical protein